MQKISNSVYVETGFRGCNVAFVVTKEGVVMIETPMVPTEALKWREEVSKHGTLRYLINNEPHYDHISGDHYFGGQLIAHEGAREAMLHLPLEPLIDMLKRQAPEALPLPNDFRFRAPDITLSQSLTLHLGNHTFKIMLLPGHTPFQLAVYVPEERVVFTSDNVVNPGPPFLHQAVPFAWLDSLKEIGRLDVDAIVPGHGKITDKTYLPKMSATIQNWVYTITEAINKGWSVKEAQDKLTAEALFPGIPVSDFLNTVKRNNIAQLYEVLKK